MNELLGRRNVQTPVGVELFPSSVEATRALLAQLQPFC